MQKAQKDPTEFLFPFLLFLFNQKVKVKFFEGEVQTCVWSFFSKELCFPVKLKHLEKLYEVVCQYYLCII